jgi:hypothetical protein
MYVSEAHLLRQLGIKDWTHLSSNQFLVYLKLTPQISDDLHRKIMAAVPNYQDMANETAVSLKMLIRNKHIMIMGREQRITRCIKDLKPENDNELSLQTHERMLRVLPELSRIYIDCRSHHKQTISVLAKYGLAIFYFILLLLSRMQDTDDWI